MKELTVKDAWRARDSFFWFPDWLRGRGERPPGIFLRIAREWKPGLQALVLLDEAPRDLTHVLEG